MSTETKPSINWVAVITMMFLCGMIAFVTYLGQPLSNVWKEQEAIKNSNMLKMLGMSMVFVAYLFMGIPGGKLLGKVGYKKTALIGITAGFIAMAVQMLSGKLPMDNGVALPYGVYLVGGFIGGISACLLNMVVNPMLNLLGGGGKRGNQLNMAGMTFNSLTATITPIVVGIVVGEFTKNTTMADCDPLMYTALAVFAVSFIIISLVTIKDPEQAVVTEKIGAFAPLRFRHCLLGVIAIFAYMGVEAGIPGLMTVWLGDDKKSPLLEQVQIEKSAETEAVVAALGDAKTALDKAAAAAAEKNAALLNKTTEALDAAKAAVVKSKDAFDVAVKAKALEENEEFEKAKKAMDAVQKIDSASAMNPSGAGATITAASAAIDEATKTIQQIAEGREADSKKTTLTKITSSIVAVYWLLMFVGRLIGAAIGGKVSSRTMMVVTSSMAIVFIIIGMVTTGVAAKMPSIVGLQVQMVSVPLAALFFALCGLCASVMWPAIFNLATEKLGKYTAAASGLFMMMVFGGGVFQVLQGVICDNVSYMAAFIVPILALAYIFIYTVGFSKPADNIEELTK